MKMHSWGRYPKTESTPYKPRSQSQLQQQLLNKDFAANHQVIPRGRGRSYGDSALASDIIQTDLLDNFISFDTVTRQLKCAAGVSLDALLAHFVPQGYFLPVVPGTRFVSVGGAIASDVHGKNHHVDGTFTQHVSEITLLTAQGEYLRCSNDENSTLFKATCGGMGLTGIIVDATLKLRPISSSLMTQRCYRAQNLAQILDLFDEHAHSTYSVAWLDCLAKGDNLGRSILYLGEHATQGSLKRIAPSKLPIPFDAPSFLLNRFTMGAFNTLYFNKPIKENSEHNIGIGQFFFPLDSIANWNRLYGKRGFLQYQFVIPNDCAKDAITSILNTTRTAGKGSFLSVLKKFGPANDNWLSFPIEGYTVALDFKWEPSLEHLLNELDAIVLANGGRLYLAKDARMNEDTFKASYPRWKDFVALRKEIGADTLLNSLQSQRLGL